MTVTTGDIIELMETIADPGLAEEWDNTGLQVGDRTWPVRNVRIALDPLPRVVSAAAGQHIDLLITHHPLIFRPLKGIDFGTPLGAIFLEAAVRRMSIYAAHTNLDSAEGGLNDILAARVGLADRGPLSPAPGKDAFKLVVFVPEDHEADILNALRDAGAGRIGKYAACSFSSTGTGAFIPDADARPCSGAPGKLNHVPEVRVETIVHGDALSTVIRKVKACHPYETMAYDIYPLRSMSDRSGIGRVGVFGETVTLGALADRIREAFRPAHMRIVGDPHMPVSTAAVCSGSGATLLSDFLKSGAQVFITGDMKYHDALTIQSTGRGLIDIGHFESEWIVLEPLARRLREMAAAEGFDIKVDVCGLEGSPFW